MTIYKGKTRKYRIERKMVKMRMQSDIAKIERKNSMQLTTLIHVVSVFALIICVVASPLSLRGQQAEGKKHRPRDTWEGTPLSAIHAYPGGETEFYIKILSEYADEMGIERTSDEYCDIRVKILLPKLINDFWIHAIEFGVVKETKNRYLEYFFSFWTKTDFEKAYAKKREFLRSRFGQERVVITDSGRRELYWKISANSDHVILLYDLEENYGDRLHRNIYLQEYGF